MISRPPIGERSRRPSPNYLAFLPIIAKILEDDKSAPKKQRHTAKRIWERLRDEHAFDGCYTIVKDVVGEWEQSHREVFLPLTHPPSEAQVDFGEATVKRAGELTKGRAIRDDAAPSDQLRQLGDRGEKGHVERLLGCVRKRFLGYNS